MKTDGRFAEYALVREMMETSGIIRSFDPERTADVAAAIQERGRLLLTGEGSSRIFPAKHAIRAALCAGVDCRIHTEGARQAAEYALSDWAVFLASNSGRTSEVVALARSLKDAGNSNRYALTAEQDTVLGSFCSETFVLRCGNEDAVAATKSVVEQALFYDALVAHLGARLGARAGVRLSNTGSGAGLGELADAFDSVLTLSIDPELVAAAGSASTIYFAGYNDGVAEELTLKTNEITRKKSDFLEGTYAVHGIEEVMDPGDVVVVVDPMPEEIDKFRKVLVDGVGLTVLAIADRDTPFPTIRIPRVEFGAAYLQLAAGWNLLVEIGLHLGINLDKPTRARKVGNEVAG